MDQNLKNLVVKVKNNCAAVNEITDFAAIQFAESLFKELEYDKVSALQEMLQEMLEEYRVEVEACFKIAQRLDSMNPELEGAFTGTPSESINRQLKAIGIL